MTLLKATRRLSLAALVGLGLSNCNTTRDVDPVDMTSSPTVQTMRASFGSLAGEWVLTNYKNQPLPPTLQSRTTLVLKKESNDNLTVGGQSFVNYYGGSFLLDETKGLIVSAQGIYSTKIGGSPEAMQAENDYYINLGKATYFEFDQHGQLRLYTGPKEDASTELLYFTKK
ncbi:META domain-containing protein [Spirosoma oryzicola]|uniref:META domain-containing protein n=1 Tax=Spirosoma oryzicola TaxID=2898794 RepID=UPI001E2EBBEC|nr:META domain-containing protein [Spirosoma oryzicola]UHG93140.1 META domain-containing protein [Spirosoma oryzicola]